MTSEPADPATATTGEPLPPVMPVPGTVPPLGGAEPIGPPPARRPGAPAPPPPTRRRWRLWAAALVAVTVIGGLAAFLAFAGGGSRSPSQVVEGYLAALRRDDCEKARDLLTGEDIPAVLLDPEDCEFGDAPLGLTPGTVAVGEASIEDGRATVVVTGEPTRDDVYADTVEFQLVDEDGQWLIDRIDQPLALPADG